jgi:hypothetical protein
MIVTITIFSLPKAFLGHSDLIQRNAIRSWKAAFPGARILLFGDDPGVAEAARELGVSHHAAIQRNAFGTPLVSDVFARAHALSGDDVLLYVNCDILFLEDLPGAIACAYERLDRFLLVGRRWNLEIRTPLEFDTGWEKRLIRRARTEGKLQSAWWIDYFAFTRGLGQKMPPFAVGRPAWDNWLIYHARQIGCPVVDATAIVTVVHQDHDYAHVPGATGDHWRGPESDVNVGLAGGLRCAYSIEDASHVLDDAGIHRKISLQPLRRWLERMADSEGAWRQVATWLRRSGRRFVPRRR